MLLSKVFQLHVCYGGQCTYPCFPAVLLINTPYSTLRSHCLLSHITIVEPMDSGERGMNPVAMTIINSQREYWLSWGLNQRPHVLESATLTTELWGSAGRRKMNLLIQNNLFIYPNILEMSVLYLPDVLESATLTTELWGSAGRRKMNLLIQNNLFIYLNILEMSCFKLSLLIASVIRFIPILLLAIVWRTVMWESSQWL